MQLRNIPIIRNKEQTDNKHIFIKKEYDIKWANIIPKMDLNYYDPLREFISDWIVLNGFILDAGCGDGKLLRWLRKTAEMNDDIPSVQIYGLDISVIPAQFYDDVIVADVNDLPFQSELFTNICCTGVLCCVTDIKNVIKGFYHILKPGGRLFFTYPNKLSLWTIEREVRNFLGLGKCYTQSLNYLSNQNLFNILKESGFELCFLSGYWFFYFPHLILRVLRYVLNKTKKSNLNLIARCFRELGKLEKRLPNFLLKNFSCHTIWVAEKPEPHQMNLWDTRLNIPVYDSVIVQAASTNKWSNGKRDGAS
jgi:SAM-dependent methyltransferase